MQVRQLANNNSFSILRNYFEVKRRMKIHWIEAKQLDRVTNYSTRTEIINTILFKGYDIFYYCTFAKRKEYYGLKGNIKYLGLFRNQYIKYLEFNILVTLRALQIVLISNYNVIMVNQNLIRLVLPALFLNRLIKKDNKFITDIRTTPTDPYTFESDMKSFHSHFKYAIKYFNGYSFITPFMEKYLMQHYEIETYKSVNWSSGVDIELFNPSKYPRQKANDKFTLFYHGGISVSRGNLDLIKACEILVEEGYEIELIQIGIRVDKAIDDYIENHNLYKWCKLLPPVDITEIPQMIADCDLPVLPFPDFMAWRVSSPIKLMEYLAMGKKVLAPDMESFTDVFSEGSNLVFYYNTNNSDKIGTLSKGIKQIIDKHLLKNGNFYPEARDFVTNNYTWGIQASYLLEFCSDLLTT